MIEADKNIYYFRIPNFKLDFLYYVKTRCLRVWNVKDKALKTSLNLEEGAGSPTSVAWVVGEENHCIVGN